MRMPDETTDPDSLEAYTVQALHEIVERVTKLEAGAWKQVGITLIAAASHVGLEIFKALHPIGQTLPPP